MFIVVAGIYVVLTLIASLSLALVGRCAFRVQARGVLMLRQLAAELPRFFDYYDLVFLLRGDAEHAAALTVDRLRAWASCSASGSSSCASAGALWLLPLRAAGDRSMSSSSGASRSWSSCIIVLFFIQAFGVATLSLFAIAVIGICIYLDRLYRRDHPRRLRIRAAPADRGRGRDELQPLADRSGTVILPQAWPVILPPAVAFAVSFIKDTALVSQVGVFELTFAGKVLNNRGLLRRSWSSAPCSSSTSPCPIR